MKTRKAELLAKIELVVTWTKLVSLSARYHPEDNKGRPLFAPGTMLHTQLLQRRFTLSDPVMGKAFFAVAL